jgi:hypothetical protein
MKMVIETRFNPPVRWLNGRQTWWMLVPLFVPMALVARPAHAADFNDGRCGHYQAGHDKAHHKRHLSEGWLIHQGHHSHHKATVKDNMTNLSKSRIKLYVDGKRKTTFSYNRSTDRLSHTSGRLSYGRHMVKIVVRDATDNVKIRKWSFKVVR